MVGRLPDIGDVGGDRKAKLQVGGESGDDKENKRFFEGAKLKF